MVNEIGPSYKLIPIDTCDVIENPTDAGKLRGRFYFEDASIVVDDFGTRRSEIRILPKVSVGKLEILGITVYAKTETEEEYSKIYYVEAIGPQMRPAVSVRYTSNAPGFGNQKRYVLLALSTVSASQGGGPIKVYSFSYIGVATSHGEEQKRGLPSDLAR
jgi:hypothetical protein